MDNSKFWDILSKNYDSQVNLKYVDAYKKTIEMTKKHIKSEDIVLDYACGTGITTIELSEKVQKIYAIDISENMINIAKKKAEDKGLSNINFEVANINSKKIIDNTFDVVMAFNILYFIKDIGYVLERINNLLKPNGLFISVTDCFGENKSAITIIQLLLSKIGIIPYMKSFKTSELESIIRKAKFDIIETHNLYDTPPNYYIVAKKQKC